MKLDSDQTRELTALLREYLAAECEVEIGQFEAEFLLDFVIDKLAEPIYRKGVEDAKALLGNAFAELDYQFDELAP